MEEKMKVVYPVVISQGSKYLLASIPDCEIDTQGESVADAIEMARDALSLWCVSEQDSGHTLPEPSALEKVRHGIGDIVTLVDADIDAYRRLMDNQSVEANITIPARLYNFAEQNHLNFSAILQNAIQALYSSQRAAA
jgi:predicted RNase H-like HicB family nuclease